MDVPRDRLPLPRSNKQFLAEQKRLRPIQITYTKSRSENFDMTSGKEKKYLHPPITIVEVWRSVHDGCTPGYRHLPLQIVEVRSQVRPEETPEDSSAEIWKEWDCLNDEEKITYFW